MAAAARVEVTVGEGVGAQASVVVSVAAAAESPARYPPSASTLLVRADRDAHVSDHHR